MEFITGLFDTSDFPARWKCGHWTSAHGWLHIISDVGVWAAYFAIPLVLGYFVARRRDLPFRSVFLLFVAFILLCGTTHLMEAVIFWWPAYRLAGALKLITAVVSWVTVLALMRVAPAVLAMRTPEELEREVVARTDAERRLKEANAELERRVEERTADLGRSVAALQRERELLRTTLVSIGDAVVTTDSAARVTGLNTVAEALTGWTNAEAQGQPLEAVFRIVNETTRLPVENPAMRALKEGVIVGLANHTVLVARDGAERSIDDSAAPIRSASGEVVGCVLVFRDISERKALEAEQRVVREQIATTLESVTDGFMRYDRDWRIVYVNAEAERINRLTRSEMLGRIVWEVFPTLAGTKFEAEFRRAVADRVTIEFENYYEPFGRWYSLKGYPTADGGLTTFIRDITERKGFEQEIARLAAESERQRRLYETVLMNTPDFVYVFSLDHKFVYANDALLKMWGRGHEDAIGKSLLEIGYEPWHAEMHEREIDQVRATRQPIRGEVPFVGTSGRRMYDYIFVPVIGADGEVEAVAGTTRDVTERRQAEEQIKANEERQTFLVTLADTLRPLSDPIDVQAEASRVLGEHLGANRVVYFEIRGDEYVIERDYTAGVRPLAGRYPVAAFGPAELNSLLEGRTVIEIDATTEPGRPPGERAAFAAIQVRGHVDVPLVKGGRFVAGMTVHVSDRRDWTRQEVALIEDTAERTWAAVERVRAEVALRTSEERRRLALAAAELGTWQIDLATNTFTTDERFRVIFAGTIEAMDFEQAVSAIHADDRGRILEAVAAATRPDDPAPYAEEYRVVHPDGSVRWVFAKGRVHYDRGGTGQLASFDGTVADITARKRDEEKNLELLRELETQHAFIKAVISQVPAAIVVADAATGQIRLTNEEAHRIVKHEYHPGKRLEDYGNTYIVEAYAADGSRYSTGRWPLDRALRGETVVAEEIENVMFDQSRVIVRVNASPIRVDDKIVAAVVAFHDITDRKLAEQAARFLADASAALSQLVDYEDTLQRVAHLAVTGFADWAVVDMAEEPGSARRLVVAHADPSKADLAAAVHRRFSHSAGSGPANILRTGRAEIQSTITDEMLTVAARDESDLHLLRELGPKSYIGVPLRVQGETVGALTFLLTRSGRHYGERDLAVAKDLAARASIAIENSRLYARLKEADRRKDEFLATLAHELRNPLAPIRNGLQVIRMAGANGTIEEARAMMERQLTQLIRLVDDLLDVSRVTSGKLELRRERVELKSVIDAAVETSRPTIEEAGHEFTVAMPDEPIWVDGDLTRLAQVVSNLLNNSAKYTNQGGYIRLAVRRENGTAVLAVADNGIGIPPNMLGKVFEMFTQVDRTLEKTTGGLGIGLSLVKGLVEMHGGTIEARSEGEGRGSEFIVRLPVAFSAVQKIEPTEADGPVGSPSRRRILVTDDNVDSAESLGLLLKLLGNDVRTANDGLQAVDVAETFRPEIILLDIAMPKLTGYEACRRIRDQPWSKNAILVAMTGWGQEEDKRRSQDAGFDHHLVKPVDPSALDKLLAGLQPRK